jgi:periplasmic protein TonB
MQADAEIFFEHGGLGKPLAWSVGLHLATVGVIIFFGVILPGRRGDVWGAGGGGEAIGVSLVSNIPLPASSIQTQNVVANESKGLSKSQPIEKTQEPDAIAIPDKPTKVKPKPVTSASKAKPQPQPEEETNEVPFGQGGPVSGPYGTFSAPGVKGGFGIQGGGGDFGSQYAFYVQGIQRRVTENWMRYEIDPNIRQANRVYLVFDINRSGQPSNVQIEQSSGVPSLDQSAMRAIQRVDSFGSLPPGYSGSKVSVEFWFDYKR